MFASNASKVPRRKRNARKSKPGKSNGSGISRMFEPSNRVLEDVRNTYDQNVATRMITYWREQSGSVSSQSFAHYFNLQSIDTTTRNALAILYDQYRVLEVEIEWVPLVNINNGINSNIVGLWSVLDFDDAVLPISEATMLSYSTLRMGHTAQRHVRRYRPCIRVDVSTNGQTGSNNTTFEVVPVGGKEGWVDMATADFQWLGTKWWLTQCYHEAPQSVLGYWRFSGFIEFRQTR